MNRNENLPVKQVDLDENPPMKQLALSNILHDVFPDAGPFGRADAEWHRHPAASERWEDLFGRVKRLKPEDHCETKVWPSIWLTVPREAWEEACRIYEDEEGEDEDLLHDEDAKVNWECDFPFESDWLRARFELDNDVFLFSLSPKEFVLSINFEEGTFSGTSNLGDTRVRENFDRFTAWLVESLTQEVARLLENPEAYHHWLENALPNRERFGKLKRSDLWQAADVEEHFLRDELTPDEVREFARIAAQLTETPGLPEITLDEYLDCCEICYEGAGYKLPGKTPREKYLARADGRHGGLLDIDPDSVAAFAQWLNDGYSGSHPWEIAAGGNTTHISLSVRREEEGYVLSLAGSASSRAAETIRMTLALDRRNVRFRLYDAEHLARMANGEDWIGVLPHGFGISPRYCHEYFPEEDQVNDFASWFTIEENPDVERFVQWYPLPNVEVLEPDETTAHSSG